MSIQDEVLEPTKEELDEETQALVDPKEEEIRSSIVEKYGLDEDEDADLIEKLTKDTLAQKKSFGKVVHQKRTWREKATGAKKPEDKDKKDDKNLTAEEIRKQAKEDLLEEFAKRDLASIDVSEDLKAKVKSIAKADGISILEAMKNPYIVYLKSQEDADKKLDNAAITTKKNGKKVAIDTSKPLNPADFDLTTAEGRKEWDDAKKARNK